MNKNALRNAEAGVVNKMRAHSDAEYAEANAFVKKHQAEMKSKFGGNPRMPQEAMNTDAYMCNTGRAAGETAVKLAKGLDTKAFPVRK